MSFFFMVFSLNSILSALLVVTALNPVHSILFLILVFLNAGGILLLIGAEFLALMFLVVYIGAIAVLFLFVIMLLNIKLVELDENIFRYLPIGGIIAFIFLFEIYVILTGGSSTFPNSSTYLKNEWINFVYSASNLETLGQVLFTYYTLYFILAGFILLIAMIGAILLTLKHQVDIKRQDITLQIYKKAADVKTLQPLHIHYQDWIE